MIDTTSAETPQQVIDRVNALAETAEQDVEAIGSALVDFWRKTEFIHTDDSPDWALFARIYLEAERLIREKINPITLPGYVEFVRKNEAAFKAQMRYVENEKARTFVQHEWATHRGAYNGNKSEFARIYVRRVANEFAVKISEKQMREIWLKDTRLASKPDGLPAGGQ